MTKIIPKTFDEIKALVGLRNLLKYCDISDETALSLFEMLASGRLDHALATNENQLKLVFADGTTQVLSDTAFDTQSGDVDSVLLSLTAFTITYSAAYLAAHRSSSSGDSGGSSSNSSAHARADEARTSALHGRFFLTSN